MFDMERVPSPQSWPTGQEVGGTTTHPAAIGLDQVADEVIRKVVSTRAAHTASSIPDHRQTNPEESSACGKSSTSSTQLLA